MSVAMPRPLDMSSRRAGPSSNKVALPPRPAMTSRTSSTSTSTVTSTAPVPILTGPGKDTSSSAGKVFAKPSKEWVLPERAKPGRKVCAEEPDNKRQSQNRLSQRAHRARRTDYIQTLEERLRQYEADEIHSNVRLQEVARALKTDNERMKNELLLVKAKINELVSEREQWGSERKGMEEMCASLLSEVERLRSRLGNDAGGGLKLDPSRITARPAPVRLDLDRDRPSPQISSTRRSGPTVACPICPDPDPDCPCQQNVDPPLVPAPPPPASLHQSDCGLCQNTAECLCRVVNEDHQPVQPVNVAISSSSKGKCDVCSSLTICLCEDDSDSPPRPPAALPRATAAVSMPLRPRAKGTSRRPSGQPLWRLDNVVKKGEATCTGDPENCDACRNDSFGREFCGHLFEQTGTTGHVKPCSSCPGNCLPSQNEAVIIQPPTPTREEQEDTMRCDEAWKQLKAHPNAKFASLALLADVVAGRTKCTGPTIELTPTSTPSTPVTTNATAAATASPSPLPPSPVISRIGVGRSPLPPANASKLAPKRHVAVETSAVRDALRILDSTPSRGTSEVEITQVKSEPIDLEDLDERATKKLRTQ